MTITYANGTLTITYTGDPAKIARTLLLAAQHFYPHYPIYGANGDMIPFDSLTNAQRMSIIDAHLKRVILDAARTYNVNAAMEVAKTQAQTDEPTI